MTNDLAHLSKLADDLADAEAAVAVIEHDLATAKKRVKALAEHEIPEAMDSLEMAEFTTKAGFTITVKDRLTGRNLSGNHAAALEWLRKHQQGGLIRTTVGVPFSPGSESDAEEFIDRLSGEGIAAQKTIGVNAGSLKSAVTSMLADGVDVPMEVLGIYQTRVATVRTKK